MITGSVFEITIPFLPPSSNKIYVNARRGGGRFLSKEAASWQKRVLEEIVAPNLPDISSFFTDGALYWVMYEFFFEPKQILNTTYGTGAKNPAQDRYKRLDTDNRVKLLSDTFSKGIGLDDKHFFALTIVKKSCSLTNNIPQTKIAVTRMDPAYFGV